MSLLLPLSANLCLLSYHCAFGLSEDCLAHKLGGVWSFGVSAAPVQQPLSEPGGQSQVLHTVTLRSAASPGGEKRE